MQGAFLLCKTGKVTYDSLILKLTNNLCCDRTHQAFDPKAHARADYHTFGAAGEKTECCGSNVSTNGGKQTLKRGTLPHEGSAWVFTQPQDLMCLAKNDEFTGDAIKLICFVDSLQLILWLTASETAATNQA